jgi:hypothetical protein
LQCRDAVGDIIFSARTISVHEAAARRDIIMGRDPMAAIACPRLHFSEGWSSAAHARRARLEPRHAIREVPVMSRRMLSLFVIVFALVAAFADPAAARGGKPQLALTADAVVPGPGDFAAAGTFKVSVSREELKFEVIVTNVSGQIETIALYRAGTGFDGPMVLRLSPSAIGIQGLNGYVPVDRELGREISRNPERFYMEIHTNAYPQGAMRGQLRQ